MQIFKTFETDDIVKANPSEVSTGLWTGDTGSLASFFTSSAQTGSTSGQYYFDIYNADPLIDSTAEVQFAIAYGHIDGGGAETLTEDDNALLPTKATYNQYRNILLGPGDTNFTFLPTTAGATCCCATTATGPSPRPPSSSGWMKITAALPWRRRGKTTTTTAIRISASLAT